MDERAGAGRGLLVVLALAAFVALAGLAGWLWLPRASTPRREPPVAAPTAAAASAPTPAPPTTPGLQSSDPSPERGLWCTYAGGVPVCAEGLAACERARGGLAVAAAPCERTTPSCFVIRDRTGEARVCTPTPDGCEQARTGPFGAAGEILTGCLPSNGDVVPDKHNLLVGITPPEQWCTGSDCTGSENGCATLRAQLKRKQSCARKRLWCSGQAPMPFGDDCASSERACEKARRSRVDAGRTDFGPCQQMP